MLTRINEYTDITRKADVVLIFKTVFPSRTGSLCLELCPTLSPSTDLPSLLHNHPISYLSLSRTRSTQVPLSSGQSQELASELVRIAHIRSVLVVSVLIGLECSLPSTVPGCVEEDIPHICMIIFIDESLK